jgi:hypothetical protein
MLESGTSGSVGGEGGNLLVYPATTGYRQPEDIPPGFIGEKYAISRQIYPDAAPSIHRSKQLRARWNGGKRVTHEIIVFSIE